MGFRFRKSVKLGKGVKLNFGKKSVGVSFGGRHGGVSINSKSGARGRVSLPGTGISYSTKLSGGKKKRATTSNSKKDKSCEASTPQTTQNSERAEAFISLGTLVLGVLMALFGLVNMFFGRMMEGAILFGVGVVLLLVSYFKQ